MWVRFFALIFGVCCLGSVGARAEILPLERPETDLSYEISVRVDPETGIYDGAETLTWTNRSSETVEAIPIHLYLNAFSNGSTTWLQETGSLRFGAGSRDQTWGFTEIVRAAQVLTLAEAVDQGEETKLADDIGQTAPANMGSLSPTETELTWKPIAPDDGNPFDRSLMELKLAEPVEPGGTITVLIDFEGRLPTPAIARTGCVREQRYCFFGQWYPQLGKSLESPHARTGEVFDLGQFHSDTEFFNDFADFKVTINAPADVEIGATGLRVAEEMSVDGTRQTVTHIQDAVTNFAFVAAELDRYSMRHQPAGAGPEVEIILLASPDRGFEAPRAFEAITGAFDVLGQRVGPYPYEVLTIVYPSFQGATTGGMEYPTLFTGILTDPILFKGPLKDLTQWEIVDIHEFGHMYFQGVLATNEREHAFMDEGFNTFWEWEIVDDLYGEDASFGKVLGRPINNTRINEYNLKGPNERIREALGKRPSWLFEPGTSGSQIYSRPGATLRTAKNRFGRELIDEIFQAYYQAYAFNHPDPDDFLEVAREVGGDEVEAFLREGFSAPRAPDYAVSRARTQKLTVPPGRYVTEQGVIEVDADSSGEALPMWLTRTGALDEGPIAKVTDPGWADRQENRRGDVLDLTLDVVAMGDAGADDPVYESRVRIDGSAWDHLPVEVVFTFADGTVARDIWDGRAAWRGYRIYTRAALVKVETDPDGKIMIDADPSNDFRVLEPDPAAEAEARSWGASVGTFVALMLNGVATWL